MEAVVHAGRQTQRDIAAVAVRLDQRAIAEQVFQCVGETLGLVELGAGDGAASADDGVAGTDQNVRPAVDRARPVLELAGEAVVHAAEVGLFRLAQVEVGKQLPHPDGHVPHQRLLDPAEPADQLGGEPARDPVGEEEVDVLLLQEAQQLRADRHGTVNSGA